MQEAKCVSLGDVLYLHCSLCNPPKMKLFVVAQVEPLWMFIISSHLTDFAMARKSHRDASPQILASENPNFLTHDSYVGCNHISFEYSYDKIEAKLLAHPEVLLGHLHENAKAAVAAAIRANRIVERKYLRQLLPLWSQFEVAAPDEAP